MPSIADVSSTEFKNALTPGRVRTVMIIQAALTVAPLALFATALVFGYTTMAKQPDPNSLSRLTTLTIVSTVVFLVAFSAGLFLYRSRFTPARLEAEYSRQYLTQDGSVLTRSPAERAISVIQGAMLMRTLLLEGSALFGLVPMLLAAVEGLLFRIDWVWINALPLAALVVYVAGTFPTTERIESIFESQIRRH